MTDTCEGTQYGDQTIVNHTKREEVKSPIGTSFLAIFMGISLYKVY